MKAVCQGRPREGTTQVVPYSALLSRLCASALFFFFLAVSCSARSARLIFIGAGTVDPWHGNVEQTEVHPELRPMVDEVIHHHPAEHGYSWHSENFLTAGKQFPRFSIS